MLISVVESLINKYFIGEPYLIMRDGEWEKTMSEQAYTHPATPDTFTSFAVLKTDDATEVKTSLFCLQNKKTKLGKISNGKGILAVIPETFWDKNKVKNATEHGFFIETNGKIMPRLNPNKKHISICYTSKNNRIHTYTIFTQLINLKPEKIIKEQIEKHNPLAVKPLKVVEPKRIVEKKTVKKTKTVKEPPKFYDKFKIKKY